MWRDVGEHGCAAGAAGSGVRPGLSDVAKDKNLKNHRAAISLSSFPSLRQLPILDPMRPVRLDAEAFFLVFLVRLVIPLEPDDLTVPFEREDVRGDPVEEPAIVADNYGTAC